MSLSKPKTNKKTFHRQTRDFIIASSSMQGWRVSMEDTHAIVAGRNEEVRGYFGVFDGHGGTKVANYVSRHLYSHILNEIYVMQGDVKRALEEAFMSIDNEMMINPEFRIDGSGCTGVVIIIHRDSLYCANIGDSRAVAFVRGQVFPLSRDHKPSLSSETQRILDAGGFIANDRVNGDLALSRAFGDFRHKKNRQRAAAVQAVTAFPEIVEAQLNKYWQFMVLACDGIWEVMSNEAVCDFIRQRINVQVQPGEICEELLNACLSKKKKFTNVAVGLDNITVIIVIFKSSYNRSYFLEDKVSSIQYLSNETHRHIDNN